MLKNFEVQLNPFTGAVEKPGSVEFRWINGSHAATPPDGFDDYFGAKPLYRFIEFDGVGAFDDIMNNIRDIPTGSTPEETMRLLVGPLAQSNSTAVQTAIDRLLDIIDQDPEIEVKHATHPSALFIRLEADVPSIRASSATQKALPPQQH